CKRDELSQDLIPQGGIANDPTFADAPFADFELGLDERHDVGSRGETGDDTGEHLPQSDEGYIDRRERRAEWERFRLEVPGVDALPQDDARVVPERPVELSPPDVERDDARRSGFEQHLREAARRS